MDKSTSKIQSIHLRSATLLDMALIFKWRNDPWIIEKGSLNREVPWDEHKAWFERFIADENSQMFIIEMNKQPIGQVRFIGEAGSAYAEVSIYILKPFIGKGYGAFALDMACRQIKKFLNIKYILAYILMGNMSSIHAFERCSFEPIENSAIQGGVPEKSGHSLYIREVT